MAHATRSSNRVTKLRRDSEFAYDEATLNFLTVRNNSLGDAWQQRTTLGSTTSDRKQPIVVNSESFTGNNVINTWSTLNLLPSMIQQAANSVNILDSEGFDIQVDVRSQDEHHLHNVNKSSAESRQYLAGARPRHSVRDFRGYSTTSSTRLDFIGSPFVDPNFLLMSPTVHSDSSEVYIEEIFANMQENNRCQQCSDSITCADCQSKESDRELRSQLSEALGKIKILEDHMSRQNETIRQQSDRLHNLETSRSESSGGDSRGASSSTNGKKKAKGGNAPKGTKKLVRIEEEGERQYKLMTEQLRNREQLLFDVVDVDESSEEELTMRDLRKKMSKMEREMCNNKVSSRMKQAGATYPMADFETSNSSGTDSSEVDRKFKVRSRRRKVKSGAKVKTRPVIRQMLWPHTVANEEDGEDVLCEDIGLAKFLSCFTCIMTSCGKVEAAGRARLLNAISSVLECLPWAEARLFHNMVMVKLEQRRYEWTSDFSALGNQFIDKKVRENLRYRNSSGGSGQYSKGSGKGARHSKSNPSPSSSSQNRGRSSQPGVCRNWNFGTCTFAERCNRLHVCCTCADAGKPGEQHKASIHKNSRGSDRNYRPRV